MVHTDALIEKVNIDPRKKGPTQRWMCEDGARKTI